jgi:hypothetical protein
MGRGRRARPLSVGRALDDGFGLLAKRPLAAVVWGVAYLVLAYGPMLAIAPSFFGSYADLLGAFDGGDGGGAELETAMLRMHATAPLANAASVIGALLSLAVVPTAIYRTVLRPKEAKGFGLRLGKTEALQALVWVTWFAVLIGGMVATLLGLVLIGVVAGLAVAASGVDFSSGAGLGFLGATPLLALLISAPLFWVMLRLSMGTLISFDRAGFRLFDSWNLTRGRVWRLFGLAAVLYVLTVLVTLAVFALGVGIALLAAGGSFASLEGWFARPEAPWIAGALGVGFAGAVSGPLLAVGTGAWTSAYRQLSRVEDASAGKES